MRILVTGHDGQVGWELCRTLAPLGDITAVGRAELNLVDTDAIRGLVRDLKPDWIINPAAYTAVDRAEQESDLAHAVNGVAPGVFAEEAARLHAGFIHYSTDYVFDGRKTGAYVETDPVNPLSVYGRSKLEGEQRVASVGGRSWTLRTSWVYGGRGKNFLLTMLRLANANPKLRVVADQFGAPTWSRMIAETTACVVAGRDGEPGLYHLTANGRTSWHGFASAIVEHGAMLGLCPKVPVEGITTADYPTPAHRPANSQLASGQLAAQLGLRLPDWESSLTDCMSGLA
jgi:dTDP-4-dehydrorhamnose reductase